MGDGLSVWHYTSVTHALISPSERFCNIISPSERFRNSVPAVPRRRDTRSHYFVVMEGDFSKVGIQNANVDCGHSLLCCDSIYKHTHTSLYPHTHPPSLIPPSPELTGIFCCRFTAHASCLTRNLYPPSAKSWREATSCRSSQCPARP